MALRLSEAERLHRHNQEMKLALDEGLSLAEARWRLFQERMNAADRMRDQRFAAIDQENCARRDGRLGLDSPARPPFWWERD